MASPAPEKPIRHKRRFNKMKPQPKRQRTEANPADPEEHEPDNRFNDETDLCKQLMSRYSTSTAPQHQHLLATAAAFQSILSSESRPLTPTSYFLAAMDNLSDSEALDSTAVTALSSFVSIVTPLIPEKGVASDKATESVAVLVGAVLGRDGLGVSTLSGVVKCLGVLIAKFCDLKNWKSVKLGFGSLLELSVDKRPKLRRAAQDSLVDVLKSFKSSPIVIKEASKLVLSLLKSHAPNDTETVDPSKVETASDTKHVELLHVLNLLKITVPHLSDKISSKILAEIVKLMTSNFLPQTRHVFQIIEVFLTSSGDDVIGPYIEVIADTLASYVLLGEKNPVDTIISAAMLFKVVLDKLQARGSCSWMKTFSKILCSLEGLLYSEAGTASQATDIIKELIHRGLDVKVLGSNKRQSLEGAGEGSQEADIIKETCLVFENALNSCSEVPREQILSVIAVLFRKLGEFSFIFMKGVVPKLADLMNHANLDSPETIHLKCCIGSAVVALGPEKILGLIPISFNADSLTCSNNWLVPILNDHIVGASLECYVDHVVPLAKSLQRASHKVKKAILRQELQAIAQGLLELLPAFCNYPVDTHSRFESMAAILIAFLKKDPSMHKTIAVSLKVLVSQNRIALGLGCNAAELNSNGNKDLVSESTSLAPYSVKTANRNIKALASHSSDLLQTLIDMLIASPPEKRLHLKEAIGCLASITKSSITKKIFSSRLEKLKLVNTSGEFEKPTSQSDELTTEEQSNHTELENTERRVIMELASCLVEGASEDLIQLMYNFITYLLEETKISGHGEAYCTLSKILEHHHWFCSSRSIEVFELLINLKAPVDIQSLKYRFSCFHFLLVHTLEKLEQEEDKAEEDNARTFLILNEIVLTLKDGKEEARGVAAGMLVTLSSFLKKSSEARSVEQYHKLINMILGYLSGSSAHMKSGAVSALSVLVFNDADICLEVSDLVPSILSLLQHKDLEVAKSVLGFVKVMVSCLEAKDLLNLQADILNEILPWSSVSRNHLRSKVTIILEILLRKCSSAAVQSVTPDKYRNFVKTVLQNRHDRQDSKDTGTKDGDTKTDESSMSEKKVMKDQEGGHRRGPPMHNGGKRKWENKNQNERGGPRDKRPRQQQSSSSSKPPFGRKKANFGQDQRARKTGGGRTGKR